MFILFPLCGTITKKAPFFNKTRRAAKGSALYFREVFTMTVLIPGSDLRAAAAAFLAKEAGFTVWVCDRRKGPAAGLCDRFVPFDPQALPEAEAVLAVSGDESLLSPFRGQLVYDPLAPEPCRSKLACDDWLAARGYPRPQRFPQGSEPYIVKPDRGSRGLGIWVTEDFCEVGGAVNANFLTQEVLHGPLVSVTVWGRPGAYGCSPVLGLEADDRYDLCRAFLPAPLSAEAAEAFRADALRAAQELQAEGFLELQAVYHGGVCKIIEMNSHLPELSALALYAGTGLNLVQQLLEGRTGEAGEIRPAAAVCRRGPELCGRRRAEDAGPMSPAEKGFSGGNFGLFMEF